MDDSGHTPVWTGQRVERTNARGRHRYLPAFKAWIVEQALVPGTSLAGLAMRHQVNANQLRRWVTLRQRLGSVPAPAPTLLPVMVAAPPAPRTAPIGHAIEVDLAGAVVRVARGADAATLRTVIAVLRGLPT
ncbi:MAG: IS66-like element accessory protein TnpA [Hylemonella sp.]